METVYLKLNRELSITHNKIKISDVFAVDPLARDTFYTFENIYTPYQSLVISDLPRIDLVISRVINGLTEPIRGIEVKLTALPCMQSAGNEEDYGSEIVIRPDTIFYLALSIAVEYLSERKSLLFSLLSGFFHFHL